MSKHPEEGGAEMKRERMTMVESLRRGLDPVSGRPMRITGEVRWEGSTQVDATGREVRYTEHGDYVYAMRCGACGCIDTSTEEDPADVDGWVCRTCLDAAGIDDASEWPSDDEGNPAWVGDVVGVPGEREPLFVPQKTEDRGVNDA